MAVAVLAAACVDTSPAAPAGPTVTVAGPAPAGVIVPADGWAESYCGAVVAWLEQLGARSDQVRSSLPDDPSRLDPSSARPILLDYLAEAQELTTAMVAEVAAGGIPDVDDGEALAQGVLDRVATAEQAFGDARTVVSQLPEDPERFATGAQAASASTQIAVTGIATALDELLDEYPQGGAELQAAVAAAPTCAPVVG